MKQAFAICFVLFIAMYVAAQATLQQPPHDGIVRLRWATDANPARVVQTDKFAQMNPGTQAFVDPNTGDPSKAIVQCATNTGPDVMDLYQESMISMVDSGVLLDLTPYAKEMGFDPSHTYPAIKDALMVQGKQYRFPCNVFANAIIYNKKIFDDHGVPYPKPEWTYDDFIRVSKQIINTPSKSGKKHLALANYSNAGMFEDMLMGFQGRLFAPDGLHSALNSKQSIDTMTLYHNMMYRDKIIPTPADSTAMSTQGGWGAGGLNWFSSGKAAMILIGRWYIVQVPNYPELKGNLGAVTLPHVGNLPSSSVGGTRAAGINAKSPHWREALKFLKYLASPEYSKIIDADGDSLPPNPQLALTGSQLSNEMVPDPTFHAPFVSAIKNARALDYSPFIDAIETSRWIQEYADKVDNNVLSPAEAMKALAKQIDQQIRINLERRPDLQKLYEQRTGKPYSINW